MTRDERAKPAKYLLMAAGMIVAFFVAIEVSYQAFRFLLDGLGFARPSSQVLGYLIFGGLLWVATTLARVIRVAIERGDRGVFVATSLNLKGLLAVSKDMDHLVSNVIPQAIVDLYRACGQPVVVARAEEVTTLIPFSHGLPCQLRLLARALNGKQTSTRAS